MEVDLAEKYRPDDFDQVMGHTAIKTRLQASIDNKEHIKGICLVGPSGLGKTSLARVMARQLGATASGIIEINIAQDPKVETLRSIIEDATTPSLFSERTVVILDEVHRLRAEGWDCLLKPIEDTPEYLTWILCTSEDAKVKDTLKRRVQFLHLKPLPSEDMQEYVEAIADAESIVLPEGSLQLILKMSKGSPGRAITYLSTIKNCVTLDEVKCLLYDCSQEIPASVHDLAQAISGCCRDQKTYRDLIASIPESEYGSVKYHLTVYFSTMYSRATSDDQLVFCQGVFDALEQFPKDCESFEAVAKMALLVARILVFLNS